MSTEFALLVRADGLTLLSHCLLDHLVEAGFDGLTSLFDSFSFNGTEGSVEYCMFSDWPDLVSFSLLTFFSDMMGDDKTIRYFL